MNAGEFRVGGMCGFNNVLHGCSHLDFDDKFERTLFAIERRALEKKNERKQKVTVTRLLSCIYVASLATASLIFVSI